MHSEFKTNGTEFRVYKIKGENYLIRPIYLYCRRIWTKQLSVYLLCKRTRNLPILSLYWERVPNIIIFFSFQKYGKEKNGVSVCACVWNALHKYDTAHLIHQNDRRETQQCSDVESFIRNSQPHFSIIVHILTSSFLWCAVRFALLCHAMLGCRLIHHQLKRARDWFGWSSLFNTLFVIQLHIFY